MFFFFQAEDGIRDLTVTGVQTCALPISLYQHVAEISPSARRIWRLRRNRPVPSCNQRSLDRSPLLRAKSAGLLGAATTPRGRSQFLPAPLPAAASGSG